MDPFQQQEDKLYLPLTAWEAIDSELIAGFTIRDGGVSERPYESLNLGLHVNDYNEHVLENRRRLAEQLNIPLSHWVLGEQTHEINIQVINSKDSGKGATSLAESLPKVDGLIMTDKSLLCAALFADCVPLYFFDPIKRHVGIAHAGWRGTVKGIGKEMVKTFQRLGSSVDQLHVCIGPCISGDHYVVDHTVINEIPRKMQRNVARSINKNEFLLDLKQLNSEILLQTGILRHNIYKTNYCTYKHSNLFFSYRRDQGQTGRMLGFIGYE